MGSDGRFSAEIHALIREGLQSARSGDLVNALHHWRAALERAPNSHAARLLVDLTEAYFEALSTRRQVSPPDFQSALEQIGYTPKPPSGVARVPGRPATGTRASPSRAEAAEPAPPDASPPAPEAAAPGKPGVGRTMYGLPMRDSASDSQRRPAPAQPAEPTSATPPGRGRPRYQAQPPPPAQHRRSAQGVPPPTESSGEPGPGEDPWADLSNELSGGSAESSPGRDAHPTWHEQGTAPGTRAPAWDATEVESPPPPPPPPPARPVPQPPSLGQPPAPENGLPEPLRDPFAVLDQPGLDLTSRPSTAPGVRFRDKEGPVATPAAVSPQRPTTGSKVSAAGRAGAESSLLDLFEDPDFDLSSPSGHEPLELSDIDLDELLASDSSGQSEATGDLWSSRPLSHEASTKVTADYAVETGSSDLTGARSTDDAEAAVERDALWRSARRHHSLGDFSTAESLLLELLQRHPEDSQAHRLLAENRRHRERSHLSRLRSLEAVPRLVLGQEQLIWQNLDAKKGFVLSLIDGQLSVQDIIDLCSLPRHETIAIMAALVDEGIVAVG